MLLPWGKGKEGTDASDRSRKPGPWRSSRPVSECCGQAPGARWQLLLLGDASILQDHLPFFSISSYGVAGEKHIHTVTDSRGQKSWLSSLHSSIMLILLPPSQQVFARDLNTQMLELSWPGEKDSSSTTAASLASGFVVLIGVMILIDF